MDREWIAYRTAKLKKWRKAKSKALWLADRVKDEMPDTLLISDLCFVNLVKRGEKFDNKANLSVFLFQ